MTIINGKRISIGQDCYLEYWSLYKDNAKVALSPTQFRILQYLALNIGNPVSTDQLILNVWGPETLIGPNDLHVHIKRLRDRLEDDGRNPKCLLTIRGIGYILYPREK
ncbi:helix-turn-helix domain-containing protein [Fodinisporobacter ferrooxydans]|uniref:Helix-turn-helix domain-containing protein n=1 Tax=Fodinisporobacter ferrooxydans TaxID=2901836 RepID=A0ABY4CJW8_9BACL|nr:helix-turn-helix domain-containing protein [Alicyclobacillaceae bacterium MYW30-H2]